MSTLTSLAELEPILNQLHIPSDLRDPENGSQEDAARLEHWKRDAHTTLLQLQLKLRDSDTKTDDVERLAAVAYAVAAFYGEGLWSSETDRKLAKGILEHIAPSVPLLERVLSFYVKPVFQANPHPMLNPSSARKLPRTLGGPLAQQDYYEGQVWKSHPGIVNVILWCVSHMEGSTYERLWHLLIPPMMILLDDYQIQYKLQGLSIVSQLLKNVPSDLLKRTGIDALLLTSMKTCMTFLHNPSTADLIREVALTWVSLARLTTPEGSGARFDQLCTLLGDCIIGSIWTYASRDVDTVEATIDVLPVIIKALGIATARYLKAIIPQLVFPLTARLENSSSPQLQITSLRALQVTIQECAPRMHKWKSTVMSAVAQRWVILQDTGEDNEDVRLLQKELREVTQCLLQACPSSAENFGYCWIPTRGCLSP
ncbi:unnamed protein product [Somion occarium]|uniref:Uncharacterized protein n=1 Tax=Somion occarium TaxID=3059160 RepID=A0ABP1D5R9_9APHY